MKPQNPNLSEEPMPEEKLDPSNRAPVNPSRRTILKSSAALLSTPMLLNSLVQGAAPPASAQSRQTATATKQTGFLYQPSKGSFWDPSVIYANGQYYMYTMYSSPEFSDRATRVWLATSKDGVHWQDYGVVLHEQGFKSNAVLKQYVAKVGDRYILDHGGSSGAQGRHNDLLRFYQSSDLVNWNYLYDIPLDTRFYEPAGRWDHMWMMPRNPANPADGYLGYMVADRLGDGGFGMMESADGIHYTPVKAPDITADFRIPTMEVGGVMKLGDKYYAIGGNVCHYGFYGYGVYTFVADSPTGPFRPDLDAYRLTGTSGLDGVRYIDILACFVKDSPEPLVSCPFAFSGLLGLGSDALNGVNGDGVWFLPMRTAAVDKDGHLRLGYWKQNDLAKGAEINVDGAQNTVLYPPGQTDNNPIVHVTGNSNSILVHTDKSWRGFPWLDPGKTRKAVVVLDRKFDLDKGLILEGSLVARSLTNMLQDAQKTYAGFYIEGAHAGPGTAILLEVGEPQWRESQIRKVRLGETLEFETLDRTGQNCATVRGLDDGKEHTFRLWLRGGQMEIYVDDMLMQSFFFYAPSGRIGFMAQESAVQFSNLKAYEMSI